jgi:hypothetical protein
VLGTLQKTLHRYFEQAWVQSQRQQEKHVQGLLWQGYDGVQQREDPDLLLGYVGSYDHADQQTETGNHQQQDEEQRL